MSAIYLDQAAAAECVTMIQTQIGNLQEAATSVNTAMLRLAEAWQGASAQKAQDTYECEYRTMLTETIPATVEELRGFIDGCVQAIFNTDLQLSGK